MARPLVDELFFFCGFPNQELHLCVRVFSKIHFIIYFIYLFIFFFILSPFFSLSTGFWFFLPFIFPTLIYRETQEINFA